MTYSKDLTPYVYEAENGSGNDIKSVGWLAKDIDYPKASQPDPRFVERLWQFCRVSVGQTRGLHRCELCCSRDANVAQRDGDELLLGSAEIRVIAGNGKLYAAPNLIYHYVVFHNYSPPQEFVDAALSGPCPPDDYYYELLSIHGVSWSNTLIPAGGDELFRFEKTSEGVVRIEE